MSSVPRVPQRTNLADLLRERSVQIIERWKHRVDIALTDGGLTTAELLDHMPAFLDELERSARALSKRLAPAGAMSASWVSPEHGRWRLRHGFDVDEVIREYGLLGDVILELCAESAFVPTIAETQLLHGRLFGGASAAIAAYVQRRDDELRRLASQHLAFIAHEIRNPLGTAWIAMDLLDGQATETSGHALDILRRSLKRLQTQIDDVLRVDPPPALVIDPSPVLIADVLAAIREDVLPEARLKRIDVDVVVDDTSAVTISGDGRLVTSALGNVVRNAVKFSHPGTTVRVTARAQAAEVRIDVADACGGLPDDYERMFRPWVQMESRTTGLGLGLAIARQAIDAHGGWIKVENKPGEGCVMQIGLPREPPAPPS